MIPPEAFEDDEPPIPILSAPVLAASLGLLQVTWGELEFRLPRSTGNLAADGCAARRVLLAATTDEQRAAVHLRLEPLAERQRAHAAEMIRALEEALQPARLLFEQRGEAIPQTGESLRPLFDGLRRAAVVDETLPADPWEQALAVRRNRNTGPQRQPRRAPRSIGLPSTAGRLYP